MTYPLAIALRALADAIEEDHVAYEGIAFEVEHALADAVLASVVDDLYTLVCGDTPLADVRAEARRMGRELAPAHLLEL